MKILSTLLAMLAWLITALADDGWSEVASPSSDQSQAIGFYKAGCLAGAAALPLKGTGFRVMRPSRNRYYGHPSLIALVSYLGWHAAARGDQLLIGDLSQPRGGPMSDGHSSHQIGLDVDIWFYQGLRDQSWSRHQTETLPMPSMIDAAQGRVNPLRWSSRHRDTLKLAAEAAEVERIFVNPIIKRTLCRRENEDRNWLRKIRPWWGHDAHFHVRLRCPVNSTRCKAQKPPPPGDGCDQELDQWVREIQQVTVAPARKKRNAGQRSVVLPAICDSLLNDYAIH